MESQLVNTFFLKMMIEAAIDYEVKLLLTMWEVRLKCL